MSLLTSAAVYWVMVSVEFQCRACGHASPLNHLDLDGSVRCLRCGLDQAFAESSWRQALEHAHATGDLAGSPEGRHPSAWLSIANENPFKDATSTSHQQSGFVTERGMQVPTSLHMVATVDDPKCEQCQLPLSFQRQGPELRSSCPRCGQARSYRLPPNASRIAPGLIGVMTDEHRTDQLETRVEEQPGAIALLCPSCGGGLKVAAGERIVTCAYCRTSSRIPEKTFYRSGDPNVHREPWWLAFEGPSKRRRLLERDPTLPREPNDDLTDLKAVEAPKRKRTPPAELLLVIVLPLLFLLVAGMLDFLVLQPLGLELDL